MEETQLDWNNQIIRTRYTLFDLIKAFDTFVDYKQLLNKCYDYGLTKQAYKFLNLCYQNVSSFQI